MRNTLKVLWKAWQDAWVNHDPGIYEKAHLDLEKELSQLEKEMIQQALQMSNGVIKKAAALLNLTFRSMRWKIQKHGLRGFAEEMKE